MNWVAAELPAASGAATRAGSVVNSPQVTHLTYAVEHVAADAP